MKNLTILYVFFLTSCFLASCKVTEDVTPYAPVETYPNDEILAKISNKKGAKNNLRTFIFKQFSSFNEC